MKTLAALLLAAMPTLAASGCVTTASMYVEKGFDTHGDDIQADSLARQETDTRARIQIDMKKEWK